MAVIKRLFAPARVEEPTQASEIPAPQEPIAEKGPTRSRRQPAKEREFKPRDLYQEVTDSIVEAIENGTAPWQQKWDGRTRWPVNGTTQKPYHGVNVMMLAMLGLQDPRWCTYQQAKERGWQVRKGEHGSRIYFYKPLERKTGEIDPQTDEPKVKTIPVLKSYTVFNLSQIDGAPEMEWSSAHEKDVSDLTAQICEEIVEATGAEISHGHRYAAYSPSQDRVYMPDKESFESEAEYYATLLHEIAHWTGHESRLKREFGPDRKSVAYAREELRAELASAMLSMHLGLPAAIDGHAAYVGHYLQILRDDKKEIFRAAKDAERMTRYVMSFHPEFREGFEQEHREQMSAAVAAGGPEEIFDATDFDFEPDDIPMMGMRP
ncbi:ArdC family protein [Cupriavidus pinatubonensis]|uniref:DUF1738 domain-containing protein n=1 Tax=Cupriavidus pinatubonensis TaxID=248026 RepID=A0ABM8WQR3_9BURK|nr:zincin-like metallopeptidase domain-containing protein [Cupriavidus pinatubonensis]CAG9169781.1 hypothetical protein LMG23994_01660 [Cupriavidus pinatubonensis]